MLRRSGTVAMVGNDTRQIQCQYGSDALRKLRWSGVENVRREDRDAAIAGKEVGGEHEPETLAVKSHVSVGVAGKMNCPQAMPYVDEVAIVQQAVRNERLEGQNASANALQTTRDSRPAAILRTTAVVVCVETWGGNPSTGFTGDRGHVEDVVEMPVGDDDSANGFALPAALAECALQKEAPADESRVDQIQPGCVSKDVKIQPDGCSDLDDIGM